MFENSRRGSRVSIGNLVFTGFLVTGLWCLPPFEPEGERQTSIIVNSGNNRSWVVANFKKEGKLETGRMCAVSFKGEFSKEYSKGGLSFFRYFNPPEEKGFEDFCPTGTTFAVDLEGERQLAFWVLEVRGLMPYYFFGRGYV